MYTEAQLEQAKRLDQEAARRRERSGSDMRIGKTGRLTMQVSMTALMNAVNTEGREVLSDAGKGYWEDQKRLYPWIDAQRSGGPIPAGRSRNRFGRVIYRKIYS